MRNKWGFNALNPYRRTGTNETLREKAGSVSSGRTGRHQQTAFWPNTYHVNPLEDPKNENFRKNRI